MTTRRRFDALNDDAGGRVDRFEIGPGFYLVGYVGTTADRQRARDFMSRGAKAAAPPNSTRESEGAYELTPAQPRAKPETKTKLS
jgi:hypothetical protein